MHAVSYPDIVNAALRLQGVAHRTPVMTSRTLDERLGGIAFLKCENLQRTGSFKIRGAFNALAQLDAGGRARGVLAYSSGNHGQALAHAGQLLGAGVVIVMPADAPQAKIDATRGYGAEVVLYDPAREKREEIGGRIADERGLTVVPPFDHPHVIAGQGTATMELIDEVGRLDLLLAPCGGGGLLSGSAIAAKTLLPRIRVVGVEPALADDACRSFRTRELQTVRNPPTIADGARTPHLGKLTFPVVLDLVDDMVSVSEDAIVRAARFLWERMKIVVEPTGALAVAALLEGHVNARGLRVGVILSGGNADIVAVADLFRAADAHQP